MHIKLETALRCLWYIPGLNGRWGVPVLIQGKPGTAKTARIRQVGHQVGLSVETIILSLREPSDLLGLPVPGDGTVHYMPPAWARALAKAGRGVLFADELSTCPPAVQAAGLRVFNEGVVGDLTLPPGVRFVAAQNALEHMNGGYDISPPLANRFVHLTDPEVSVEDWSSWMMAGADGAAPGGVTDPERLEKQVMDAWPEAFARATGLVVAFLKANDSILKLPANDPKASKAWPSPRTWEIAVRVIAGCQIHGLSEMDTDALIAGCVSPGASTAFAAFRKDVDLPDPAKLLDGKIKFQADNRLDRTQAVLAACTALVCPPEAEKRIERAKALTGIMKTLAKDHGDLVYSAWRGLVKADLRGGTLGKEAQEALAAVLPTIKAAGVVSLA